MAITNAVLDFVESNGTRWAADNLKYLLDMEGDVLKAELKRLLGVSVPAPDPVPAPAPTPTPKTKE